MDNNKVYVCVVFHHSDELRPRGYEMAENFCNAWKKENIPYKLVVLDNESTCEYPCLEGIDHDFIRIDDQSVGGCTGAWNILCKHAYDQGAEIITGFADDVQLNPTFSTLIKATTNDNEIYAPLSDGIRNDTVWGHTQASRGVKPGWKQSVRTINGFWMSFTRKFWEQRQIEGDLFPYKNLPGIYKWCKQEAVIDQWIQKDKHTKAWIIGDCWIHHTKLKSYPNAARKFETK